MYSKQSSCGERREFVAAESQVLSQMVVPFKERREGMPCTLGRAFSSRSIIDRLFTPSQQILQTTIILFLQCVGTMLEGNDRAITQSSQKN